MKLNVGCGNHYVTGWTNLDVEKNDHVKPDVVGSLLDLPDEIQDVEQVYLGHVLEHLEYDLTAPALKELWARCQAGARVAMVGPDVFRASEMLLNQQIDIETFNGVVHGAGRWANDVHLWACDEMELVKLARRSGLDARPVSIMAEELDDFPVVSRVKWQCAVIGKVMR